MQTAVINTDLAKAYYHSLVALSDELAWTLQYSNAHQAAHNNTQQRYFIRRRLIQLQILIKEAITELNNIENEGSILKQELQKNQQHTCFTT